MKNMIALTLAVLIVESGLGQAPEATPTSGKSSAITAKDTAVSPAGASYLWPSPTATNPYPSLSLPNCGAPPACAANEDGNGRLLRGDPLLDHSAWVSGPGWFGALEIDPVGPWVTNRLIAPVPVGGVTTVVRLPSAPLNWTVMPYAELGYRLGQGAGSVLVSYRGLNAAGSGSVAGFDGSGAPAPLRSHLNMSVIDIDYASHENSLGPLWDMNWHSGVRVATIFFDSDAANALLSQHESNNFVGAGIHAGVALKRRLGDTGFALLGQLDGGAVLGSVHQLYSATIPGVAGGQTLASANEPAPVLQVRFGVDYGPRALPNLHVATGYLFERWWTVGETFGTRGEVTFQGVFIRGEWRY